MSPFRALSRAARQLLAAGLCGIVLLAAGAPVQASPDRIEIAGSTTLHPVVDRIAREFMAEYPGHDVTVRAGGSGAGLEALLREQVDIASSSRFISAPELERAHGAGIYPVPFRIADDCIIPVVHRSNRIRELSLAQLRGIYRGDIRNWSELGGEDHPIEVVSRSPQSGTYGVWRDMVMEGADILADATVGASSAEVVRAVSANPDALGYISLGHLSASVKPLRVDGVMGSIYTVRDGSYVLSRPLFLFSRGWPQGWLLKLINYVLAPGGGQVIIRQMGLIPAHPEK